MLFIYILKLSSILCYSFEEQLAEDIPDQIGDKTDDIKVLATLDGTPIAGNTDFGNK